MTWSLLLTWSSLVLSSLDRVSVLCDGRRWCVLSPVDVLVWTLSLSDVHWCVVVLACLLVRQQVVLFRVDVRA